jgi:hypothetical protein
MTSAAPTRVRVVAHRTAATPRLLDEVQARARRSPCSFTLLVPRPYWDPETEEAATTLELALPLLDEAADGHVEGTIGDSDPFVAVEQTIERGGFDEIIISTLPARVSHWLRRDLPHRVEALGLPVTGSRPGTGAGGGRPATRPRSTPQIPQNLGRPRLAEEA